MAAGLLDVDKHAARTYALGQCDFLGPREMSLEEYARHLGLPGMYERVREQWARYVAGSGRNSRVDPVTGALALPEVVGTSGPLGLMSGPLLRAGRLLAWGEAASSRAPALTGGPRSMEHTADVLW